MKCRMCGARTNVIDTAYVDGAVYRLRRCTACREPEYTKEVRAKPEAVRQALAYHRKRYKIQSGNGNG